MDPLLQYLVEGDLIGFVVACYTTRIGSLFWAMLWMTLGTITYIRTKQLVIVAVLFTLLGGLFMASAKVFSFVATFFLALGLAGLLWEVYHVWRS